MRFTDYLRLIIAIQYACTNTTYISEVTHITGYLRLTASVDTSARTSHDLDKVILFLTRFHLLQKFSCIAKSRSNCHTNIHACHLIFSLLDALCATHICKFQISKFFSRQCLHRSTKSCFHNTAGRPKDYCRSRRLTHRIIKAFIRKCSKFNTTTTDQSCQFPGSDGNIYIRYTSCILMISSDLELLGRTWHHADRYDILRIDTLLLGKVSLHHRTKHLLR